MSSRGSSAGQFEEKLTPDQLRHIRVLERSMETNVALSERAYPGRNVRRLLRTHWSRQTLGQRAAKGRWHERP